MDISLKKVLLAGIGTMAYSYEKGVEIVENLIKKGEITVNQGMELNEELKRKDGSEKPAAESSSSVIQDASREMLSDLNIATREELKALEDRVAKLENK